MQINRLFEIVYLLINRKKTTAKDLSKHFEVSVRTILRDIEILSHAGIPVYTMQGKGGGIYILDNFVLNKTALSEEEQNQILYALQSLAPTDNAEASMVLSKLRTLFDKTNTDWIEVDFSRWGHPEPDKERFELLRNAIIQKHAISISYPNSYGEMTQRIIHPLKLIFKSKAWYLQGFCLLRQDYRTFKVSRMLSINPTEEKFIDKAYLPPVIETGENPQGVAVFHVVMKFPSHMAYRIYDEFDAKDISKQKDGTFIVSLDILDDYWLYGFLLSFGTDVEILGPKNVREVLLKKVEDIRSYYSSS